MSKKALQLLVECGLLKRSSGIADVHSIPENELSKRLTAYSSLRKAGLDDEISSYKCEPLLNAQLSTWSSKFSRQKTLSSLLIYDKLLINDPLVQNRQSISVDDLQKGLEFFDWLRPLITNELVSVFPIDFYDRPSESIPIWSSEDAFRSSISPEIHDFVHSQVFHKSVVLGDEGQSYVLNEDADLRPGTALRVGFKDDIVYHGVELFRFETIEKVQEVDGSLVIQKAWDPKGTLSKEKHEQWRYQVTNQAIIARLKTIFNQSKLALELGHTYVTESPFESKLLSMSNTQCAEPISPCVKFFDLTDAFGGMSSPNELIKLRGRNAEAFKRFNESLILISNELQGVAPAEFDFKCQKIYQKEIMPQVDEIRTAIDRINVSLLSHTLMNVGAVALAINTGSHVPLISSLLLSATNGVSAALPAIRELQAQKKKPAYIWHRLVK